MLPSARYLFLSLLYITLATLGSCEVLLPQGIHQSLGRHTLKRIPFNGKQVEDNSLNTFLAKRVDPKITIQPAPWLGSRTWIGYEAQPPNLNWSKRVIRDKAKAWYELLIADTPELAGADESTMVAALWVPCEGVFYGTIPHSERLKEGDPRDITSIVNAAQNFVENCDTQAVRLWQAVGGRKPKERNGKGIDRDKIYTLFHAEDMACYVFESLMLQQGKQVQDDEQYPEKSYITCYGRYSPKETSPGIKESCGKGENEGMIPFPKGARIDPPCSETMIELGVNTDNDDEW